MGEAQRYGVVAKDIVERSNTTMPREPASRERGLGVVFGAPLALPGGGAPVAEPSRDEVARAHAAYVAALTQLWEAHKAEFGYAPDERLVVV